MPRKKANGPPPRVPPAAPKTGDAFTCASCGMRIAVTADCGCADGAGVLFTCCGTPLTAEAAPAECSPPQ